MSDDARRCTAKSKQTGKRCRQPAAPGRRVCHYHGARGGAPKGNLNGLLHGAYAKRVLNQEEQRIRDAFLAEIRRDFVLNSSSDEVAVQMAAMAFLQYLRAQRAGEEGAASAQARIVRNCLRDLKATRSAREPGALPLGTTPAEWATALVARLREAQTAKEARGAKKDSKQKDEPHESQA